MIMNWPGGVKHGMAAQVGPCDEADRAGRSAQLEYDRRYTEWRNSRWQASFRWIPVAVLSAVLGGWYLAASTGIRLFGVAFAAILLGAVGDLLYRPPGGLAEWRRAAAGERSTGKLLAKAQRDGYLVLHDRRTAGDLDVEHLLIGPTGAYLLDSKNWVTIKEPVRVQSARFWIGREPQTRLLDRLRAEAATVASEIEGKLDPGALGGPLSITPVVVVHGARVAGAPRVLSGVAVVEGSQLLRFLARGEKAYRPEQVRHLALAAEQVLRAKDVP